MATTKPVQLRNTRSAWVERIHPRWQQLVNALCCSGVTAELALPSLHKRLGVRAQRPPGRRAFIGLLESYFQGDGSADDGLRRRQQARLLVHHETHRSTARDILARLAMVVPELDNISLLITGSTRVMSVWADGMATIVPESDIDVERVTIAGVVHKKRAVTVRGLVSAVNRLLAMLGHDFRFVQLVAPDNVEAFVGVSPIDSAFLERGGALELKGEELDEFTVWGAPSSEPKLRSVA